MTIAKHTSIGGGLWLTAANGTRVGQERLQLLEEIAVTGSISQAARNIGLSYRAAWDAVNAINNLADEPLVLRTAGGRHGGSTLVTPEGHRFIQMVRRMSDEYCRLAAGMEQHLSDFVGFQRLVERFSMRTSARNQFQGKVLNIKRGVVDAQVTLALDARDRLVAIVTNDSVDTLGLIEGRNAYALIKSSFVILTGVDDNPNTSARNRLAGTIAAIRDGPVNSEVILELDGGKTLAAVITRESVHALNLVVGQGAAALIKASHIILGVD